jgi:putative FmdB family regulatory protein
MAVYEYEHSGKACTVGAVFEVEQSIHDEPLTECPRCGGPVRKLISLTHVQTTRSNAELRDMGFTKLVRRDDGVYENVTRRGGESRYMHRDRPETMPDLKKIIRD